MRFISSLTKEEPAIADSSIRGVMIDDVTDEVMFIKQSG